MVRPALYGSIEALKRAIRSAGVTPEELHSVLLVGGSSRMPIVAQLVGAELGRPVAVDAHPKHAVALGAAWLAAVPLGSASVPAPGTPGARGVATVTILQPPARTSAAQTPAADVRTANAPDDADGARGQPRAARESRAAGPQAGSGGGRRRGGRRRGGRALRQHRRLRGRAADRDRRPARRRTPPPARRRTPPPARPPSPRPAPRRSSSGAVRPRPPRPRTAAGTRRRASTAARRSLPTGPTAPEKEDRPRRGRTAVVVGACLLVLAIVGGVAYATNNLGLGGGEDPSGARTPDPVITTGAPPTQAAGGAGRRTVHAGDPGQRTLGVPHQRPDRGRRDSSSSTRPSWADATPNINGGFHLHIYGGDGTDAAGPDHGRAGGEPRHLVRRGQGAVDAGDVDGNNYRKAIGDDAEKVCARIAEAGHHLVKDNDGASKPAIACQSNVK